MGFKKGNKFGSETKRGKGKISPSLRESLDILSEDLISSMDINKLNDADKIRLLSVVLKYSIVERSHIEKPIFKVIDIGVGTEPTYQPLFPDVEHNKYEENIINIHHSQE